MNLTFLFQLDQFFVTQSAQAMGDIPKEVQEKLDAGYAKIQANGECKSLLKKYLTKEVYDELKGE